MTRFTRSANGKYVVQGKSYEMLIGTRAQVWHGTAYKTSGGLTKSDLLQNKNGRIVSRAKHATAKKENRLVKSGFGTKKGVFGYVQLNKKTKSKRGGAGNMPSSGTMGSGSGPMGSRSGSGTMGSGSGTMGSGSGTMGSGSGTMGSGSGSSNPLMKIAAIKSQSAGRRGRRGRSRRGGSGMSALSPSSFNGKGVGTSGVDLQFIAGNAA
jgi:hypothetical protein